MENNFKYDISIIIPVYNNEKYIGECIKSIEEQKYDLNKIEIILINDGSTDKSLEICQQLAKDNKNIKLINQQNQGVSLTRNTGIKMAEGKYIMFLDSDDFISKNAVKEIVNFFDKHQEEIDLLTFPIYNYNNKTQKTKILKRYDILFDKTGIIDLKNDYDTVQTTINIVIKNKKEKNLLFDTNIFFHEDLKYNIEVLFNKQKFGYLNNVKYFYRKSNTNTSAEKDNPLYTFNQFVNLFNELLNKYKDSNGITLRYVQSIILNTIRWRLVQGKLFLYNDYEKSLNEIKNILKYIEPEVIANDKQMNLYHKIFLLELKGEKIKVDENDSNNLKEYSVKVNDSEIVNLDHMEIVINKLNVIDGKLKILAYLKSPLLKYYDYKAELEYIDKNNTTYIENAELTETIASYFKSDIKVANFKKFDIKIDINQLKELKFNVYIDNYKMPIKYYFNKLTPFNKKTRNYVIYRENYRISFKKEKFKVKNENILVKSYDNIIDFIRYMIINYKINYFKILAKITRSKKRKIWLYYDRTKIIDNAYYQFKHDFSINDGIEKYYILDDDIEKYKNLFTEEELKNVIRFGTLQHKLLYLNCDKILTAFSSLQEYCPFPKKYKHYKDLLKYEFIYLQHGILHARLLKMYCKEYSPIDKFVISSEFEKNNLINNYSYKEEDLIPVGMPRLDEDNDKNPPKNKIIYAPSWRKYLIGKAIKRTRETETQKFINSSYYKEIINFLSDEKLNKELKEHNLKLDFKLHPIFKDYRKHFEKIQNENISLSFDNANLNDYKLFITDFSSFQFDFVKLNRPILYFTPDIEEFKAGLHTYRELDLKYEDAFGKLCLTGKELVDEVIKLINNNFIPEQIYKERTENFFYKVKNRKDKLYKAIIGEEKL